MRTLPKHLRPRWRYLAVEIETWPDARIDRRAFQGALWDAARALLGDPGSADCGLTVMRFRFDEKRGVGETIVRVRRAEVERGRAALSCIQAIDDHPVGLVVRGTSGTIRACTERLQDRSDGSNRSELAVETTVSLPATGRPEADRSETDRSAIDRPAIKKGGGRLDVRTDAGFLGATALDLATDHPAETDNRAPIDPDGTADSAVETETPDSPE